MKEVILSDCIVIGFVNYGESDRIVKLFSSERGLISAIAKRVRSHKHKWAGILEIGQTLEVKLTPPKMTCGSSSVFKKSLAPPQFEKRLAQTQYNAILL